MSEIDQVLAAIDKFESDLGFTAPELIPMRIGQLREMVRDVFEATGSEDGDDWFEVGDANAGTSPAQFALVELMGHAQVTGSWRETVLCGRPMLEITRLDAAERRVQLVGPESVYRLTPLTEAEAMHVTRYARAAITAPAQDDDEELDYDIDNTIPDTERGDL
jgi:hypothetical protein